MKKRIIAIIVTLAAAGMAAFAQPGGFGGGMPPMGGGMGMFGGGDQETLTPKERATVEADRLKDALELDAKQYKKVFTLFKNEYTIEQNRSAMGGGFGGGMGMPPMGGGMGMPPMGGGGMPPMGGGMGNFDTSGIANSAYDRMMQQEAKKIEARAKKMVKILTPEQYRKWEELNQEDQRKREEEMRQNALEMQQQMEEFRKQFEAMQQ